MQYITPINQQQQDQVITATQQCIKLASEHFQRDFSLIPVNFDLKGRMAGMYKVKGKQRQIRYNPHLFAKYFTDNLTNTVPHEVAHYITDQVHGIRRIRPHGREWQAVMELFGAESKVTCDYDLQGIPLRQQRKFDYHCACRSYTITARRHNMIQRGERLYQCPACASLITEST